MAELARRIEPGRRRRRGAGAAAGPRRPRTERAAALLRPAAALVPRPAGAGERGLQHPGGGRACAGALDAAALARRLARGGAPPRVAAHPLRRRARRAGAGRRSAGARCRCRGSTSRACRPSGAREQARRLARAEALRPFDLAAGPLLRRAAAAPGRRTSSVLLLTMHHVVSDGWSLRRAGARAGGALRRRSRAGRPSPLPELPIQYADYAVWQRRWLQGEVLAAELAHWRARLAGAPPVLDLPLDRPRAAGGERPRRQPAACAACRGAARRCRRWRGGRGRRCSWPLLAAFQALLVAPEPAQEDVSVGTPVAGRDQLADRRPDRLLRQHAGAARRPRRASRRSRSCWGGCGRWRWRPTPTRICRSRSWSRSCSRGATSASRRCSRSPSPSTHEAPPVAAPGRGRGVALAARAGDGEVRPQPDPADGRRGLAGTFELPRRAVRRRDDRAAGGALPAAAGRRGGRSASCVCRICRC